MMVRLIRNMALATCLIMLSACSGVKLSTTVPNTNVIEPVVSDKSDASAVIIDPTLVDSTILQRYQRALELVENNEYSKAEAMLVKINTTYPDLAGPYVNLGIIYTQTEKMGDAEKMFDKALELKPNSVIVHNQLGILYRKSGRFDQALQVYQKAIEIDPTYVNAYLNLGILYDLYLLQADKAFEYYEKYQQLINYEDDQVKLWIVDLKNRFGLGQEIMSEEIMDAEAISPEIINPETISPATINPGAIDSESIKPEVINSEAINPEIMNKKQS